MLPPNLMCIGFPPEGELTLLRSTSGLCFLASGCVHEERSYVTFLSLAPSCRILYELVHDSSTVVHLALLGTSSSLHQVRSSNHVLLIDGRMSHPFFNVFAE
jgi:hypothetical protein